MKYLIISAALALLLSIVIYDFNRDPIEIKSYFPSINRIDTFTLSGGTFDMDVKVVITENVPFAFQVVLDNIDSSFTSKDFNARGVTFYKYGYNIVMWLPERPVSVEQISIANHELFHVVKSIMFNSGIDLSDETEEAYAYEFQYVSKQFYEKIK